MSARATDADLVRAAGKGDEEAFRQLFERKHRRVYLIARQMLGSQALAEEVVQEAFLALWRHCDRYRDEFAVDTWLARIATSRAIDRWRAERRHVEGRVVEAPAREGLPAATVLELIEASRAEEADPTLRARWREVQALWDELAQALPPQQRAAFVLREIEGLEAAEVADALGCSPSTVRSHVALARKALRQALEQRAGPLPSS